jgi:hypothetical protein
MAVTITHTPETVDFVLNKPAFKVNGSASPIKLVGRFRIIEKVGEAFTVLPDVYLDPDNSDNAVFYIDQILREYFDTIDTDLFSLATIKKDLYSLKTYDALFYEWDGTSLGTPTQSASTKLLYGKLFYQDWPSHDFLTNLSSNLNYLNNLENKINTWQTAKNYLYWLNHVSGTNNIELRVTIYYTDKTTENQTIDTYSNSTYLDTLIVPAGYTELNLASYTPAKTIYRYDLGLYKTDDTQVGKTISYYLQNKPWWAQQFLFRNDYGVLEAVIAEGKESEEIKSEIKVSRKRIQYDYAATDFEYTQRINSRVNVFNINLGPFSKNEAKHMKEIINDKFFKVGDTKLIPCNILGKSLKPYDQNKDLQVIKLKYQYAFEV